MQHPARPRRLGRHAMSVCLSRSYILNWGVECRWGRQKSRVWAYICLHCLLLTLEQARCCQYDAAGPPSRKLWHLSLVVSRRRRRHAYDKKPQCYTKDNRTAHYNLNKLIGWLSDIIKSRSNPSYLLLTFRQHLFPLSKWLPVYDFLRKFSLLRRKVRRRDVTRYMSPHLCLSCVSLNILLANFDQFSDPSCWAVTFSAQDADFIPSYDVIFLYHVICYSRFVLLCIDRLLLLPCGLWP